MYEGLRIAVVVPAYNEEAHVGTVIETVPDFVDHMVVVDDGSTDDTAAVVRAVGDERLELVSHHQNQGVGAAVVTGHRKALDAGADVVCLMAGDGQSDPDRLDDLVGPVVRGECDVAKANRLYAWDSFRGMPWLRVLGNVVLSFLVKFATGYWRLVDPLNGYVALHRRALERLPLDRIGKGYTLETDVLIYLNIVGMSVRDVPIPARYGREASGIRLWRDVPAVAWLLFRGFWRRITWKYVLWSFSPIALLLFGGLALCAWGVGFGIWVLFHTLGEPVATTGTVMLAIVPFLMGFQLLLFALVLDILESSGTVSGEP